MEVKYVDGINKTLFDWAEKSLLINEIGWLKEKGAKEELAKALGNHERIRYLASQKLSEQVWSKYPELGIYPNVTLLATMEYNNLFFREYRDHSTHMFKVYLLGLFIYEENIVIQEGFEENGIDKERFLKTWTATALWHDMGYLFENDNINEQNNMWKEINQQYQNPLTRIPAFKDCLSQQEEERLYDSNRLFRDSIDRITAIENNSVNFEHLKYAGTASGLTNNGNINAIEVLYTYIRSHPTANSRRKPYSDHGIVSAMLLLRIWFHYKEILEDLVDSDADPNKPGMSILSNNAKSKIKTMQNIVSQQAQTIIDAARAIALHNINKTDLDERQLLENGINIRRFHIAINKETDYEALPFAYLLRLVDGLQDWDRMLFSVPNYDENNRIIYAKDMNISPIDSKTLGIWFRSDDLIYRNVEYKDSIFSKIKNNLSDYINVDNLLKGMKLSHLRPNIVNKSQNDINIILFGNVQKELMETLRDSFCCNEVELWLYNRSRNHFVVLRSDGSSDNINNDKMLNFIYQRFKEGTSDVFIDDNGQQTGFALIATHMGALGFIVLKDMPSTGKLKATNPVIVKLNEYGEIFGGLYLRSVQKLVQEQIRKRNLDKLEVLGSSINNYIPFGNSRCISVFLDIRQLSGLFIDDKENDEHKSLELLHLFSYEVERIAKRHYGVISSHFGGGMLITFNNVSQADRNCSCFRAICTMVEIRKAFKLCVEDIFHPNASSILNKVKIGMGASSGMVFFSAFGYGTSLYYTGVSEDVGFAKKIENLSGRSIIEPFSNEYTDNELLGEILVSASVYRHCNELMQNRNNKSDSVTFFDIKGKKVSHPHAEGEDFTLYMVEDEIDHSKCPLSPEQKCLCCTANKN